MSEIKYCPECGSDNLTKRTEIDENYSGLVTFDRRYVIVCHRCDWKGDIKGADDRDVQPVKWPIDITMYLHGDDESVAYDINETLADEGMTPEEIEQWHEKTNHESYYLLYEVPVQVRLYEDGKARVVAFEDHGEMFVPKQR